MYLSETGNVVPFENFGTKLIGAKGNAEVSQITINTEARDVIRDLFPNIPDEDINQIIKTAFQKVVSFGQFFVPSNFSIGPKQSGYGS